MPLLAYNKTTSPVTLGAGSPTVILPPSLVPGARGKAFDVTAELWPNLTVDPAHGRTGGLTGANYATLQAQVTAGSVEYAWTHQPEYSVGALTVTGPVPGSHASTHKTGGGDVLAVASHTTGASAASGTTGITSTAAGSSHSHSVASATPGITVAKMREQQHFGALAAPGTNYVGQYAGGAGAIDDSVGPFTRFLPPRTIQIAVGVGGVPTEYTIDGLDQDGNPLEEVIIAAGAGIVQGTKAFLLINRVRSDVDPIGTTDVQTGNGFGLGTAAFDIYALGVDGVYEAIASADTATGTVIPTTVPNSIHTYDVQYRVLPTASQAAHDHGATTGAEAAHTHSISDGGHTHSLTDAGHTHNVA
jgi:hypothetical protein